MYENNKDIGWKKKNNNSSNSNGSYDDTQIKNKINQLNNDVANIDEQLKQKADLDDLSVIKVNDINVKTINFDTDETDVIKIPDSLRYENNILQLMCGEDVIGEDIVINTSSGNTSTENNWIKLYETITTEEQSLIGINEIDSALNITDFLIYVWTMGQDTDNYGFIQVNEVDSKFLTSFVEMVASTQIFEYNKTTEFCTRIKFLDLWNNLGYQGCKKWWTGDITSIKIKSYDNYKFKAGTKVLIYGR